MAPTKALAVVRVVSREGSHRNRRLEMIQRGLIFCHVVIMIMRGHDSLFITWGSQMWKGAAPIFIKMLDIIR